ncbi:MAG: 2Fe-2S iron-sulfur cluster-binding protein [Elusimicrobia bacterium]|nr:2Fe-2S iron-sulfur cluster-binding protein [Elusimicrobiota bacterium]
MAKTIRFTLDGRTVEAREGETVLEAAQRCGLRIPHYCWHQALGNPGNCRMCNVEVEGAAKPMVSCRLQPKEGMVVRSAAPAARRWQRAALEFHLVDHPLDCPVCDQSGECGLQDYYMDIGRYPSSLRDDKWHMGKRMPIGPHIMLDQERCIMCTRCTRFVSTVSQSHELGIFGRGHSQVVDVVPGRSLDNPYSGCLADICPVGALTDRDFRFQVRVWYLDEAESVCPGCSRLCSIWAHTSTRRPWHNQGRRLARLKPRLDPEVNGPWICDEGRYGFAGFDSDRLGRVLRLGRDAAELPWDAACDEIAVAWHRVVRHKKPEGLAVVASGALSNQDWAGFRSLFVDGLRLSRFLFAPEPDQVGAEDGLLRRRDKVPNLAGGRAFGFGAEIQSLTWQTLAEQIEQGEVWGLYVVDRDPLKVWGEKGRALLERLDLLVYQGPRKGLTGELARFRLPATAWLEEDGEFTDFQGRVRGYRRALEPLGQARPDWEIFAAIEAAFHGGGGL